MAFLKDYPVRTMAELKSNPEVGYFTVNARICDIVAFDPWWYALCDCPRVFTDYIGEFECVKCQAPKFSASSKYVIDYLGQNVSIKYLYILSIHQWFNLCLK
jgi:hypothetical protein